jgi:hypothetical protein
MFDELDAAQQPQQEAPQQAEQSTQPSQETQKESNMRILRERAEAAERRSQDLERMIQMNMNQQQTTKLQLVDDDDDLDLNDDSYIEGKQFKRYVKSLKQQLKNTKKEFEEFNQKNALAQAEIRLKTQFNDFDSIVSKDNLDKLAQQKPALYRSIMANQDIYDRGYLAYELIKGNGMANDYAQIDKKIDDNKARPRSVANANSQSGDTPLARVGDYDRRVLTKDRIDQLLRQVEEAKRNK